MTPRTAPTERRRRSGRRLGARPAVRCAGAGRYAASPQLTYYPEGETVPAHGGLSGDWQELAYRTDGKGHRWMVRTIYEIKPEVIIP